MNKSYQAENKELAFRVWRQCGQNVEQACRELRRRSDGFPVSKPTLYAWMEEGNWKERAARADAEEQKTGDAKATALEKALVALTKQQEKYERWFDAQDATTIDAQVQHAYNNLVQLIVKIDRQMKEKPDLYLMTPIVMEAFVRYVKNAVKDHPSQDLVFALVDRFMEEVKPADAI